VQGKDYICCMAEETKPIKRSKELAPLSREHHDALLFVWKIRQGLQHNASTDKLREYTIWYWHQHIKPHFYQEEKILLPYMPDNHPLAIRLKKEHESIRELILSLDKEADTATFSQLCNLVNDHIRFEERELFGYLEQNLIPEQLTSIFKELEEHPVSCEEWKDEFWVKK
jgi:hemerythrin-like domain-containing protein